MKYNIFQLKTNRILDIVLNYTGISEEEFYKLKNKRNYARVRNVCIKLMYDKGIHYNDIAESLGMTMQNVYYQIAKLKDWNKNDKFEFERLLYKELSEEIENKNSDLSMY